MRAQTLGSPTDDNGGGLAWPTLEDVGARFFGDGADAHRENGVTVERHAEVGRQREEMRHDAGKCGGEAGA